MMQRRIGVRMALLIGATALLVACGAEPAIPQPSTAVPQEPTAAAAQPTDRPADPSPQPATAVPGPTAPAPPAATAVPGSAAPAPPAVTPATRLLLRQDPPLEGDDVRNVQQRLLDLGYRQVGNLDGIFGPQTDAAVRTFQTLNDLEIDGVAGPQTWQRLFSPDATPGWAAIPIVESALCEKHIILGATYKGAWLDNSVAGTLVRGGESYRIYMSTGALGTAVGSAPRRTDQPPFGEQFLVSLDPERGIDQTLAIGGDWDPLPRLPTIISDSAAVQQYAPILADFLHSAGLDAPPSDLSDFAVWQVDLDGDGSDELLISAAHHGEANDNGELPPGEFSVVLVQQTVGGIQKTTQLVADVALENSKFFDRSDHSIIGTLDLNGDGLMEVVVESGYFESGAVTAYTVTDGSAKEVLSVWCGV